MQLPRRWTEEQKAAIADAATQPGMTAAEITRQANAGTLGGLEAFPIPEGTVRDLVTRARRRADINGDATPLDLAAADAAHDIATMLRGMIRRAKRRAGAGTLKPTELRELAATAREVAKLERETRDTPRSNGPAGATPDPAASEALDTVGALAAELTADSPPARETPSEAHRPNTSATATRNAPDAQTNSDTPAGRSDARSDDVRTSWHALEAGAAAAPQG